jgi:hypothetical protein
MHATCPAYLTPFDLFAIIMFGETCKLRNSSLGSLLQPFATSTLIGPDIFLSTLFPNTPNLCYSFSVRDQGAHL